MHIKKLYLFEEMPFLENINLAREATQGFKVVYFPQSYVFFF